MLRGNQDDEYSGFHNLDISISGVVRVYWLLMDSGTSNVDDNVSWQRNKY